MRIPTIEELETLMARMRDFISQRPALDDARAPIETIERLLCLSEFFSSHEARRSLIFLQQQGWDYLMDVALNPPQVGERYVRMPACTSLYSCAYCGDSNLYFDLGFVEIRGDTPSTVRMTCRTCGSDNYERLTAAELNQVRATAVKGKGERDGQAQAPDKQGKTRRSETGGTEEPSPPDA